MQQCESFTREFAEFQRDLMFWIGDVQRYAESRWPDAHHQIWPEWVSPGMLARAAGTCRAYPQEEDRQHEATYTQYMQNAGRADRQARLAAIVDEGLTSDESRKAAQSERTDGRRWLLAIDVHYFLHRFWFSGAGVEAAMGVATWIQRTVGRLKEKGLTDVACCFDSRSNHRKELDAEYKARPPKDSELVQQLNLVRELLERENFSCVSVEGFEADDVMASFAKQFAGNVTILTQDKDCRQCLSKTVNMLLDVEWTEDETSGEALPNYKWLSAQQHTEATGISPGQWVEFQMLMGDACDGVKGAPGIGEKGAADLVKEFGTAENAIAAAKADDERIKPAKRKSLIEFEPKLEVTRDLVTLRDDLSIPVSTRI
jgi:5'-3' exonuclease